MPDPPLSKPLREEGSLGAALVAMVLIWGYSWVVMKIALRHAHPFDFAALRVAIGCALLFAIVKFQGRSLRLSRYRMVAFLGLRRRPRSSGECC